MRLLSFVPVHKRKQTSVRPHVTQLLGCSGDVDAAATGARSDSIRVSARYKQRYGVTGDSHAKSRTCRRHEVSIGNPGAVVSALTLTTVTHWKRTHWSSVPSAAWGWAPRNCARVYQPPAALPRQWLHRGSFIEPRVANRCPSICARPISSITFHCLQFELLATYLLWLGSPDLQRADIGARPLSRSRYLL